MVVQVKNTGSSNREALLPREEIKILVVDDREDNLFSIETILEKDGYTIKKALSGRAALKLLLIEQDFTLILMDVQMPDMSGLETANLIYQRDKLKHIPIIFITANSQDESKTFEGYKMGAVDFIYKPINPELLRYKVGVFVELYRKTHQLLLQEARLKTMNSNLEKEIEDRRISEEKIRLLNQQLLQNNAELKATNEELDRFAYVASHDLQEPLRKIMVFSDMLKRRLHEGNNTDIENSLFKIVKASERMQSLITDLLKFSRHNHDADDFERTDLNEVLSEVMLDMETAIQKKEAKVIADKLPVIWAIPSQLRQLFQNLISNAIKFCRQNTNPEIHIHCEQVSGAEIEGLDEKWTGHKFHRIYVTDNGIGFDPQYAKDIFVVFRRLHNYHEFEGTGIGLSICKKIVEMHNGYIAAKSNVNQGATFIITLPEKKELVAYS